jgi:hypothetical protein
MPQKSYYLSPAGLKSLRAAVARNRPAARSTGPKTWQGKKISSLNAFKHGGFLRQLIALPRLPQSTSKGGVL